jgi:hypothetical protein
LVGASASLTSDFSSSEEASAEAGQSTLNEVTGTKLQPRTHEVQKRMKRIGKENSSKVDYTTGVPWARTDDHLKAVIMYTLYERSAVRIPNTEIP